MATSQSTIARLESGAAKPSLSTLEKFAKATGMTMRVVFDRRRLPNGGEGRRPRSPSLPRTRTGSALYELGLEQPSHLLERAKAQRRVERARWGPPRLPVLDAPRVEQTPCFATYQQREVMGAKGALLVRHVNRAVLRRPLQRERVWQAAARMRANRRSAARVRHGGAG